MQLEALSGTLGKSNQQGTERYSQGYTVVVQGVEFLYKALAPSAPVGPLLLSS